MSVYAYRIFCLKHCKYIGSFNKSYFQEESEALDFFFALNAPNDYEIHKVKITTIIDLTQDEG